MIQTLWIPIPMPGQNELIDAAKSPAYARGTRRPLYGVKYNEMKKDWARTIAIYARAQGFKRIDGPAHFEFEFIEERRARDPDNIVSGGFKLMLDALQEAGLLDNDGWDDILSLSPTWRVDKHAPGVRLTVRT